MEAIRFLDVASWNAFKARTGVDLHVTIDGEDVTRRCFRAIFHDNSDTEGDVWLYRLDASGRKHIDLETKEVATETRTGRLSIAPGEPL